MTSRSPFGLTGADERLSATLNTGMSAVETLLRDTVKSEYPFITETSRHLVSAGGKRFRPLLVLLAAQFGDGGAPGVVPAAAVVELTHLATLYHDDVMDDASLRRGAPSANARWDNTVAILTGDFLFAKASQLLADLGPEAVRIQARTFERLCTGQIRESVGPTTGEDPIEHYLSVVADKTASLIATAGQFGALLSGAGDSVVGLMTQFGERIGVAFQLSDDILDVVSDGESGKTPGTDLREGVPTLPVLRARHAASAPTQESPRLLELLDGDLSSDEHAHAEALHLLRDSASMAAARSDLQQYSDDARSVLSELPATSSRHALELLCDFVVARTS